MSSLKIMVNSLELQGDYARLTVKILSDEELVYPRLSACFYSEIDNRVLPMSIASCEGNEAVATGDFELPSLFYNKQDIKQITVKFLFSDANTSCIFLESEDEINIPVKKRSSFRRFLKSNGREKLKIILGGIISFLFIPYRRMKVQPNKVTFITNRTERLSGNIKAVFHEMTKEPDLEITVVCKKGGLVSNLPNLFRFFKQYATSRVIFVDDYYHFLTYIRKKEDVKLIQLWHACGAFKTFGFSRLGRDSNLIQGSYNHRQYDYVVVSSREVVPYYAEGFGVAMDKVIPLGSPRCDMLENEQYIKQFKKNFYKQYPQLQGKKLLLFAPTFRGGGMGDCYYPVDKFSIDKLMSQLDDDWCVIVKMHPYLEERPQYSDKYKDRVFDFTSGYDINDLLFVTDLLVTDYSSVIFEASIVGVSMLFYAFDLDEYSRDRDFYCHFSTFVPGKIVNTMEDMVEAIKSEDYNRELIEPFRQRFFGNTAGRATANVVDFTKELLNY